MRRGINIAMRQRSVQNFVLKQQQEKVAQVIEEQQIALQNNDTERAESLEKELTNLMFNSNTL